MNYETMTIIIRSLLMFLDEDQAKALKRYLAGQMRSPDPAGDSFENKQVRLHNEAIERVIVEIDVNAGRLV